MSYLAKLSWEKRRARALEPKVHPAAADAPAGGHTSISDYLRHTYSTGSWRVLELPSPAELAALAGETGGGVAGEVDMESPHRAPESGRSEEDPPRPQGGSSLTSDG